MPLQPPILIIGAGLAGLSLGQALHHSNIPFKIFERDQAASFRAQGYRIRIDQSGGNALKRLLPASLFARFEATCATVISGGKRFDAATMSEITGESTMPPQLGQAWNADRTVLRNLLLTGIEEYIEFDKNLRGYALTENGVTAQFTDGSNVAGSMLVGADGVHSHVRKQLFPASVLLDTEGRAVFGKTLIDATTFDAVLKQIDAGMSLIGPLEEPRIKLFTDMMKFNRPSSNGVGDKGGDNLNADIKMEIPQDYIYWVLVFHKSCLSQSISSGTMSALTTALTATWHPSLHTLLTPERSNPESQAPTLLHFSMSPSNACHPVATCSPTTTTTSVTLLGDAAHAMPPVGGVGANLAFQDAADLFDVFRTGDISLSYDRLVEYEKLVRDRGNEALNRSAMGARRSFGMRDVRELEMVK